MDKSNANNPCPRLIEVVLPIREISAESVRGKSLQHGHISTLHLWWARRPLAASRAVVFASLVPDPDNLQGREVLRIARELVKVAHGGETATVLDPFSGGGLVGGWSVNSKRGEHMRRRVSA